MVYPKRKRVNRNEQVRDTGHTTVVVYAGESTENKGELVARAMATLDSVKGPVSAEVVARELDQVALDNEVAAELVARFGRDRIAALQSAGRAGGVQ